MRKGTNFYSKKDKPQNYYRTGISTEDFRLAMEGKGWLTVTQLAGLLSNKIAPAVAIRYVQLHRGGTIPPEGATPAVIACGIRDIMRSKMQNLVWRRKVEKSGGGKNSKYRWIETENNSTRQGKARRGHAIKAVSR